MASEGPKPIESRLSPREEALGYLRQLEIVPNGFIDEAIFEYPEIVELLIEGHPLAKLGLKSITDFENFKTLSLEAQELLIELRDKIFAFDKKSDVAFDSWVVDDRFSSKNVKDGEAYQLSFLIDADLLMLQTPVSETSKKVANVCEEKQPEDLNVDPNQTSFFSAKDLEQPEIDMPDFLKRQKN